MHEGRFQLLPSTRIEVDKASTITGEYLATKLRASTGCAFAVSTNESSGTLKATIRLTANGTKTDLGAEGYQLDVTRDTVSISASTQAGMFYGVQTFLQLLPPQIFSANPVTNVTWEIPFAAHIEDQPRFKWRGFMLDTSRHFFTKDEVKRVLDEMAMHKLNTFHWHLTDDQGWRIEIKKYPKLTQVGAWRKQSEMNPPRGGPNPDENDHPAWSAPAPVAFGPDGRYGGFYTQEDIREVVTYAAARHITIVPEIEMPGHAIAALAAYPELSCDGGSYNTDANAGVNKGVFCIGKEETFTFLGNVLSEVFELFPGKYIHVGGDEVNAAVKKDTWGKCDSCLAIMKSQGFTNLDQLQGWFTGRIGNFVNEHGKTLIGWTEIVQSPLPKNAAVMDWQGGAMQAATNGHDVVMSPTKFCYLDYYQSIDHGTEPRAIGGFIPLEKVYSFEPIPDGLAPQFQPRILGGQCNLWTEYIASLPHVEYMMFPRLSALAEVAWSPKSARDWNSFSQRLQTHQLRLDALKVNYRRDRSVKISEWTPAQLTTNAAGTNLEWNVPALGKGPGQYRVAFQHTRGNGLAISAVSLLEAGTEIAREAHAGFAARNPTKSIYVLNLPNREQATSYTLRATVSGTDSYGIVSWLFKPATNASEVSKQ
jgi:hexosaminidase